MAAALHLVREEGVVMERRRGTCNVLLDNTDVGSIDMRHSLAVPVEPGNCTLQVEVGRRTSGRYRSNVAEGNFRCNGAQVWPIYVPSIVKPDLALTPKYEET